ncbi:hypothetical protein C8R45DRAFT_929836 [Mycena sanguinolenta]|nr:hypothetical protein C8R45DRAFT_929836 [Mycena sanguinolenta]
MAPTSSPKDATLASPGRSVSGGHDSPRNSVGPESPRNCRGPDLSRNSCLIPPVEVLSIALSDSEQMGSDHHSATRDDANHHDSGANHRDSDANHHDADHHAIDDHNANRDSEQDLDEEEWHGISPDATIKKTVARKPIPRLDDSEDEDVELPAVPGLTTWAKRNPGKPILCPRVRPKRGIGPEQRRTLYDRAKSRKNRIAALNEDIVSLNRSRHEMVHELSAKHKFKAKLVKQRLLGATSFKPQRKPSLFRAKIHYLSKVLNDVTGLEQHERLSLHEIWKMVGTYPDFQNMSREFKAQLLDELAAHRSTKKTGTRAANKAVSQDASYTVKRINTEIQNLYERCGMYGFAVVSKGHVQDKTIPYIMESAGSGDFIREILGIDPMDLVTKFEQWCCSRDLGFTGVDTLQSMRKEVTRMVKEGLMIASKRKKIAMNYERYVKVVILGHGVIIVGWPKGIDFTSPTHISSVDDMRKLRDAWKDGSCRWKILSNIEKEKWRNNYEEKLKSGEIVEVERQRRSDKGRVRGQNVRTAGKRQAGEKSKMKSKAVVEYEDDEDSDSEGEGEEDEEDGEDGEDGEDEEDEEDEEEDKEPERRRRKKPTPPKKPTASKKSAPSKKLVPSRNPSSSKTTNNDSNSDESEGEEEAQKKSKTTKTSSKKDVWWKEAMKKAERQRSREKSAARKEKGIERSGEKRKRKEPEDGEEGPTVSKKRRQADGVPKRRRERDDDDEEDSPPRKKTTDSDGRPKPKPRYKNAPQDSRPTQRTPGEGSETVDRSGGAAGAATPKPRATVKGKHGCGPPGIRGTDMVGTAA